jgi:methyl-accepting chemotaxis protein
MSGPNARVESAFAELSAAGVSQLDEYTHDRLAGARRELLLWGCFSVLSLLGNTVLIVVIARSITRPLRAVGADLGGTAVQATESAHVIAESSGKLSEDACEQAAALEEISSAMEELSSMTDSNLEHMRSMSKLAETALHSTEEGVRNADALSQAMDAIQQSTRAVASILKTIDEIAFQTNILALNAAVEAARAGEAGAGFAVVADEVRALAQRSAQAARETAEKIDTAVRSSSQGAELGQHTHQKFAEIAKITGEYHGKVKEVSAASEQSRAGISQISESLSKVDSITQRTAAAAQENAAAATEMKRQVDQVFEYTHRLESMVLSVRQANDALRDTCAGSPPRDVAQPLAHARSHRKRTASIIK